MRGARGAGRAGSEAGSAAGEGPSGEYRCASSYPSPHRSLQLGCAPLPPACLPPATHRVQRLEASTASNAGKAAGAGH